MAEKRAIDDLTRFKPGLFVRKRLYETESLHFNIYCLGPGAKNPLHKHPNSDEVLYFVQGTGFVKVDQENVPVTGRTTVLVPKDIPHEIVNTGTEDMIAVLAQAPLPCEHVPVEEVEGN
jgi:mannose-6-phosphate isomerase-like protein (cupin superfamily)